MMKNTSVLMVALSMVFLFFAAKSLYAQITTPKEPISFTLSSKEIKNTETIVIVTPNLKKVLEEDNIREKEGSPMQRIAVPITLDLNMEDIGTWTDLPDGGKLWQATFSAEGATTLSLRFHKFWLPTKGELFLYNKENKHAIGAITSEFLHGSKSNPANFSTGYILGDKLTLEYYQPSEEIEKPQIFISKLYYGYKKEADIMDMGARAASGLSYININCPEGESWQKEKRAVARILVPKPNGLFYSSGALVNNINEDFKPYFLTANHSISSNYYEPDADFSNILFYWDYEHPTCNAITVTYKSTHGAELVSNNTNTDFALLELTQDPRYLPNFIPYYLGWSRSTTPAQKAVLIHHPDGFPKKISFDDNVLQTNPGQVSCNQYSHPKGTLWRTVFDRGAITDGSSGSPLMNQDNKIIGVFIAVSNNNSSTYSGRFDVSWNGNSPAGRLKDWLDPNNTNIQVLDGKDLVSISGPSFICDQATYTINYLPSGATVQWSASNNNLQLVSAQGNTAIFRKNGNGNSSIQASVLINNNSITLQPYTVTVLESLALSESLSITRGGPDCLGGARTLSFCASYDGNYNLASLGLTEVEWQIYYNGQYNAYYSGSFVPYCGDLTGAIQKSRLIIDFGSAVPPQILTLQVRAKSICGYWTDWSPGYNYFIYDCGYSGYIPFSLSPFLPFSLSPSLPIPLPMW